METLTLFPTLLGPCPLDLGKFLDAFVYRNPPITNITPACTRVSSHKKPGCAQLRVPRKGHWVIAFTLLLIHRPAEHSPTRASLLWVRLHAGSNKIHSSKIFFLETRILPVEPEVLVEPV